MIYMPYAGERFGYNVELRLARLPIHKHANAARHWCGYTAPTKPYRGYLGDVVLPYTYREEMEPRK